MTATTVRSLEQWEALCSGAFAPLHVTAARSPFASTIDHRTLGNLALTRIRSGGGEIARTPRLVDTAPSEVALLSFQLRGAGRLAQSTVATAVAPGSAVLYLTDAPYTLEFGADVDLMIVGVPITELGMPRAALARAVARPVRVRSDRALSMLASLGTSHFQDRPILTSAETSRIGLQLVGAAARGAAGLAPPPRSREELSLALRAVIARRLDQPHLDVRLLAEDVAVSVRTVHEVFARESTTPHREIAHARTARARRLLASTTLRIVDIAVACGFDDQTTFTRAFRREYGETPSEFRRAEVRRRDTRRTVTRATSADGPG